MVWLACGASLLSSQLLLPAAALIVAVWVLRWVVLRKALAATPADLGILGLVLMAGVSLLISPLPELTRPQVLRLLIGIATYYATAEAVALHLPTAATARRISLILLLIGTALAAIAPISVDWYANKGLIPAAAFSRFIVIFSDSVHPNVMGGTLVLFLPFGLALVLFAWRHLRPILRIAVVVAMAVMLAILLLTQSRSAYLAFAASALCVALLRLSLTRPKLALVVAILSVLGIGFIFAGLILQVPPFNAGNATQGIDASVNGRIEIWSRGIYMVQDFPFTGIGMGLHAKLVELMYPYFINPVPLVHAHDLFLQIAVDLGLPGLIAWLATLLVVITSAVLFFRDRSQNRVQNRAASNTPPAQQTTSNLDQISLAAGLIASQVALVIGGLSDAVTWGGIRTAPLVWVLWGAAVGAWMHGHAHASQVVPGAASSAAHLNTEAAP